MKVDSFHFLAHCDDRDMVVKLNTLESEGLRVTPVILNRRFDPDKIARATYAVQNYCPQHST
jgi:hypothetical protein